MSHQNMKTQDRQGLWPSSSEDLNSVEAETEQKQLLKVFHLESAHPLHPCHPCSSTGMQVQAEQLWEAHLCTFLLEKREAHKAAVPGQREPQCQVRASENKPTEVPTRFQSGTEQFTQCQALLTPKTRPVQFLAIKTQSALQPFTPLLPLAPGESDLPTCTSIAS